MFSHDHAREGGLKGGPVSADKEYYCFQCDLHIKGPVYFKHLKSKEHARITHLLNHNRNSMGNTGRE